MAGKAPNIKPDLEICYLATLDCGNGSLRWPQKDPAEANRRQTQYDKDISDILKLNLLYRPFVGVRHLDLFDNLALAKFFRRPDQQCQDLGQAGLVRVCAPISGSFQDIFEDWALGKGAELPQHWHHLNAERQRAYDEASRRRELKSAESVAPLLYLEEHGLSLRELFVKYDSVFASSQRIILGEAPRLARNWYATQVEEKWKQHRPNRKKWRLRDTPLTPQIANVIEQCCKKEGRRRDFYTRLEELESRAKTKKRLSNRLAFDELAEVKRLVLNDPFYDEFEKFSKYQLSGKPGRAVVRASRDVGLYWVPEDVLSKLPMWPSRGELLYEAPFVSLEVINLADIVEWHTADYVEARAFQESIRELEVLHSEATRRSLPEGKIKSAAEKHVEILRNCAKRSLQDRGARGVMEDTLAQVFLGAHPAVAISVATLGTGYLAYCLSRDAALAKFSTTLAGAVFSWIFTRQRITERWGQVEALVERDVLSHLTEEKDSRHP